MIDVTSYEHDDELIAATRDGRQGIRVRRPRSVSVVLGRGSRIAVELDLAAVVADRVPVQRRRGGGCAVVLDPGNLIVSVGWPLPGLSGIKSSFARLSAWLIAALAAIGIPGVEQMGVSDLVLGRRKIGGSCIYRARDLLYYSATLLIDPDPQLAERYLKHPPREPEYRRGRSHRDFMGSLAEFGDLPAIRASLTERLQSPDFSFSPSREE